MGATGSVLELEGGGSYDREQCQEFAGKDFTEELWLLHSVDGYITGEQLLLLQNTITTTVEPTTTTTVTVTQDDTNSPIVEPEPELELKPEVKPEVKSEPEPEVEPRVASTRVVVVDGSDYEGERNAQGQKHGHGKFTYENGMCE